MTEVGQNAIGLVTSEFCLSSLHQLKNCAAGASGIEISEFSRVVNQKICAVFCQPDYFRFHIVNKKLELKY